MPLWQIVPFLTSGSEYQVCRYSLHVAEHCGWHLALLNCFRTYSIASFVPIHESAGIIPPRADLVFVRALYHNQPKTHQDETKLMTMLRTLKPGFFLSLYSQIAPLRVHQPQDG